MAFTYRSLTKPRNEFYLIYFDTDETVSVVNKKAIVEEKCLEVGDYCQVKVKKQVFKGRVVSYGCKDDVVSLEELEFILLTFYLQYHLMRNLKIDCYCPELQLV